MTSTYCRTPPNAAVGSGFWAQGSGPLVERLRAHTPPRPASHNCRDGQPGAMKGLRTHAGNCRGFTLAELLIVSIILVVLGAGLLTAFLSGQASYLSADASIQVQQEARRAFDSAVRELREAGGVITPNSVNTQQLDFQTALGYNSTVTNCPATGICYGAKDLAGGLHSRTNPLWTVRYRIDSAQRQLVRETMDGATPFDKRVLANNVDTAIANSFLLWDGAKSVTISLRIATPASQSSQLTGGSRSTGATPLTVRVRLRN